MKQYKSHETTDHIYMVEIENTKAIVEDEEGIDRIETIRSMRVEVLHKLENGTQVETIWYSQENRLIGELEACKEVIPTLIAIRDNQVELEEVSLYPQPPQ